MRQTTGVNPEPVTVAAGQTSPVVVDGFVAPGTLSGVVFDDVNGDGVQQPGEGRPTGATVTLSGGPAGSTPPAVTVDPATGSYSVAVLPGTYTVTVGGVAGSRVTAGSNPSSPALVVTEGGTARSVLGVVRPASLTGTVYDDVNGNGTQDTGEQARTTVTVRVTGPGGPYTPPVDPTTAAWSLTGLLPGTYTVTLVGVDGTLTQGTTPRNATLAEGGTRALPAGVFSPGTITGTVFDDADASGTRGGGEGPRAAVTVTVTGPGGPFTPPVDPATGTYTLTGLAPGTYSVAFSGT